MRSSGRLDRLEALLLACAVEAPPRTYVWRLGTPPPPGLRECDRILRLPHKSASADAWVRECRARRNQLPPAAEEERL